MTNAPTSATVLTVRHLRSAALLALIAASACDKPNDLPRMQDELSASIQSYRARFEALEHRADAIEPRTHALPQDTAAASALHRLGVARATIDQSLRHLEQVPTMLPAWLSSTDARSHLQAWLDDERPKLEDSVVEATSEIEAVESWTAVAEQRAGAPQHAASSTPAAEPSPPTTRANDDPAPETDGSGAPIR